MIPKSADVSVKELMKLLIQTNPKKFPRLVQCTNTVEELNEAAIQAEEERNKLRKAHHQAEWRHKKLQDALLRSLSDQADAFVEEWRAVKSEVKGI